MGTNIISKKLSRIYRKYFDLAPIYAEKMKAKGYQVEVHNTYSYGVRISVMVNVLRKR